MAWMSDEKYLYVQDCKEKKATAASAFKTRTHCGKGGRVKFPSDYLSAKELKAMNGECKSYRMNAPMSWEEFKSMPDDLKVVYIKSLREKYNVPDNKLAACWDIAPASFYKWIKCLGLQQGKGAGAAGRHWYKTDDCVRFNAWWFGVKEEFLQCGDVSVEAVEEPVCESGEVREDVVEEALAAIGEAAATVLEEYDCVLGISAEATESTSATDEAFAKYAEHANRYAKSIGYEHMQDTHCDLADGCVEKRIHDAGPIAFTGHHMPVIPKSGTMTFENNRANDALDTIKCLLSDARVNLTISWECAE